MTPEEVLKIAQAEKEAIDRLKEIANKSSFTNVAANLMSGGTEDELWEEALLIFNKGAGLWVKRKYVDPDVMGFSRKTMDFFTVKNVYKSDEVFGEYNDFTIYSEKGEYSVRHYVNQKLDDYSKEPLNIVQQRALDIIACNRIAETYPLAKQINILRKAMIVMIDALGVKEKLGDNEAIESLLEMNSYIQSIIDINKTQQELYKQRKDTLFVSDEVVNDQLQKSYEFGAHELVGAKQSDPNPSPYGN